MYTFLVLKELKEIERSLFAKKRTFKKNLSPNTEEQMNQLHDSRQEYRQPHLFL